MSTVVTIVVTLVLMLAALVGCAPRAPRADPPSALPTPDPNAPRTLDEAINRLRQTLPVETLERIRTSDETVVDEYHHGLGTWIRNNWGLWAGGPLYKYFAGIGLEHPDDMSGLILTSLWRTLHGKPLRVEDQVKRYQAYWRAATPPDPKSNRACPSGVATTQSYGPEWTDGTFWQIHVGQCCADGQVWAYQVDRGWFRAEAEQLRVWNESAKGRYDACKTR